MNASRYSRQDLVLFKAVLKATQSATMATGQDVPLELMARLFRIAETGERDPRRLVEAVLGMEAGDDARAAA